ncbi:hypothetical protein B7P43_G16883 [Cryptotermes secundus]|uniref:Uncharacterized protein n=1 Tax=Cryptotermes secundus TaxID=105785 RepID=A0A2J7QFR8_9NEOP|nr:hypothetical protein B7P43_G16883 [Cryptotermes secundus]
MEQLISASGIYFDELGTVRLFPMKWKFVSYVDSEPHRELWRQTKDFHRRVIEYCNKLETQEWYYLTDRKSSLSYFKSKVKYIDQLNENLIDYTSANMPVRKRRSQTEKRGLINFVGKGLHLLFGTATDADVENSNNYISKLEAEQIKCLHIAGEEMTIIKTTINSINSTILKVDQNEELLRNGMLLLEKRTGEEISEIRVKYERINLINEHIKIVIRGMEESQLFFEVFIDAEQGSLQPHLLTIMAVKGIVSKQTLPQGLDFPTFPTSELSCIITMHAYLYQQYLVYITEFHYCYPPIFICTKLFRFP